MPSLFSRMRTRGRSVESRQTPPSQASKPSRQPAHPQQQPHPSKRAPPPARSVSVPPQRSKSVSSKTSLGSTAKLSVASGSKSKASSAAGSSAPRMTYSSSHDGTPHRPMVPIHAVPQGRRSSDTPHDIGHARYTFAEPLKPNTESKRLGYESDGNTSFLSGETSDGEFVTALDRSPPKLEDMFLAEGMFGRSVDVSNREERREFQDPPDILASLEEDEFEPEGVPHVSGSGLSADERSDFDDGSRNAFRSGEWMAFDSANGDAKERGRHSPLRGSKPSHHQQQQQQQQTTSEWDTPPSRGTKNPRLVSPSPLPQAKAQDGGFGGPQDDLRAWGMQGNFESHTPLASRDDSKAAANRSTTDTNAFGADFFRNGFSHPFGEADDAFFETGWTDWNGVDHGADKKNSRGTDDGFNNPGDNANVILWEGTVASFTKAKQPQFFEEKKDDMVWSLPSRLTGKENPKESFALSKETNNPFQDSPPRNTSVDPESVSGGSNNSNVLVSFETFEGIYADASSSSSSRKVPPTSPSANDGQGNAARTQPTRHRRVPSNGSTNSQQQLQRSQSRKKGGGSVGSNSSAVDQILEQYRQKRLAKQQQQPYENGVSGGGQSSSHIPIPPTPNLRRSPSSESLSRTIGNLEKSIAAKNSSGAVVPVAPPARSHPHPSQPPQYTQGLSPSPGRASPQSSITYSRVSNGTHYQAAASEISDRIRIHRRDIGTVSTDESYTTNPTSDSDQFLLANIEATIGPRGVAPDMESLSGRSNRSSQYRHGRSSPRSHLHKTRGDAASVDSRTSRNSFRSYRSNISASALSNMSKESQSVATDLFRLEAQLAEVARQQEQPLEISTGMSPSHDVIYGSVSEGSMRSNNGVTIIGAEPVPRPALVEVIAPPGKLGILLANKTGERGPTHVSAVRSESVLAGKVHVGDRFVSIDGEDVSEMNSREITAVMARKADSQRIIVFVPVRMNNRAQDWI